MRPSEQKQPKFKGHVERWKMQLLGHKLVGKIFSKNAETLGKKFTDPIATSIFLPSDS